MLIIERAIELFEFKEQKKLKTDDGRKQEVFGIPKLDDANFAGGAKSGQCTLILTGRLS